MTRSLPRGHSAQGYKRTYHGALLLLTYHGRRNYIVDVYRGGHLGGAHGESPEKAMSAARRLVREVDA